MPPEDRRTKSRLPEILRVRRRLSARAAIISPHPGQVTEARAAAGGRSGALRAAIFGANDGLVSNASLIFGVAGAGAESSFVLLAGVAGLLAGAFSMAAGEYISMRVQRESFERLIHLEAHELEADPDAEREELAALYRARGISEGLAGSLADEVMRDPDRALQVHARDELGLDPEGGLGSPVAAAGSSFLTFAIGALVPLAPFVVSGGTAAVLASAVVSGATLFGVGAAMAVITGKPWWRSGLRMLAVGGAAAAVTYAVGALFGVATA